MLSKTTNITAKRQNDSLVVTSELPKELYIIASKSFALTAIANQSLADGECTSETVEHIARIAENIQTDLQTLANVLLEAQSL